MCPRQTQLIYTQISIFSKSNDNSVRVGESIKSTIKSFNPKSVAMMHDMLSMTDPNLPACTSKASPFPAITPQQLQVSLTKYVENYNTNILFSKLFLHYPMAHFLNSTIISYLYKWVYTVFSVFACHFVKEKISISFKAIIDGGYFKIYWANRHTQNAYRYVYVKKKCW